MLIDFNTRELEALDELIAEEYKLNARFNSLYTKWFGRKHGAHRNCIVNIVTKSGEEYTGRLMSVNKDNGFMGDGELKVHLKNENYSHHLQLKGSRDSKKGYKISYNDIETVVTVSY